MSSTPIVRRSDDFQVMPELTAEEYAALRDDIAEHGVIVAVVVDQHGRLLDGHHRRRVADELGIRCPQEVRQVGSDDEARDVAYALNLSRRHLSREQRRELIRREIEVRPGDSDRAVARRFGCSPSTVGSVRLLLSNLDTPGSVPVMDRATAELVALTIKTAIGELDQLVDDCLARGMQPLMIVGALTAAVRTTEVSGGLSATQSAASRRTIFEPRIDALIATAMSDDVLPAGGAS